MADVRYVFTATGHQGVQRAFASIGDEAERSGAKAARAMGKTPAAARRAGQQTVSAERRAQQQRIRALEKTERDRARRVKRAQDREMRDLERKLKREEQIEKRAQQKRQQRAQQAAKAEQRVRSRRRAAIGGAMRTMGVGLAGAAIGTTVGVLGAATRQTAQLRDRSIRLAIQGGRSGEAGSIQQGFESTAQRTPGATAMGVAGAVEKFVSKTGELDVAREMQDQFAKISVATSTDIEEIGSAAADLFEKFDVRTAEDMGKALSMLAVQGKRGAFELKDAAKQYPRLAAAAANFGFRGTEGLATLGGLSQIARRATGGPEQASTAVENMLKNLISKSADIKQKTGADIFTDDTKRTTRDITDILPELIAGTKGNQEQLGEIFDIRGKRAIAPLFTIFNKTIEEAKKEAEARGENIKESELLAMAQEKVRQEIENASDSSGAYAEIQRDLASAQQQSSVQMTAAWERIKGQLSAKITPALGKFASTIAKMPIEKWGAHLADFVGAMAIAADSLNLWFGDSGDGPAKAPEEQIKDAQRQVLDNAITRESLLSRDPTKMGGAELAVQAEQLQQLSRSDIEAFQAIDAATRERDRQATVAETPMNRERFIAEFVQAQGDDLEHYELSSARARAETAADAIQGGTQGSFLEHIQSLSDNEEQRLLRESFGATVQRNRTRTDGQTEGAMPTNQQVQDNVSPALEEMRAAIAQKVAEINAIEVEGPTAFK